MMDEEIDLQVVKQRSINGLMVLISRSFLLNLVALGGFFFLSTFLKVAEIGLFFAVSEIVAILGYCSDVGLAAALIQKKEKINLTDVRTTFTVQQTLVTLLTVSVFLSSSGIVNYFELSNDGRWLLLALTTGFFLASLKTIPTVLLERHLKFDRLVIVETVETILFYVIAVTLSWQGNGLMSYVVAILARGVTGVVLIYILAPWKIGFAFSIKSIRILLSFGLPYQVNSLISVVKDRLLNVLLFKFIGAEGMGVIGWAQTWSQKPLRFVSDNVTKVTFPAFARLQSDKESLARAVEKMLFFSSVIIFPILIGVGLLAQPLIEIIPKYQKWQPALFAFYLYLFNSGWAAISTPITNTLAAVGEIKVVSKLMLMWTILTWVIIVPLAYYYGYNGVAIGVALVALSSVVPMWLLYKIVPYNLIGNVIKPLFSAVLMGSIVWLVVNFWPTENLIILKVVVAIATGIMTYAWLLQLLTGKELMPQAKLFVKSVRGKNIK